MSKKNKVSNLDSLFNGEVKRTFKFMKTLDLYILREYLIIYICCSLAFSMLFLISDMTNNLSDFIGKDTTAWTAIHFFLLKQPGDIKFILPLSLLLSCMYAMARMGVNNEITAMRACGISLVRCGASIYIIALIVTGVNFWFNESFVPNCNAEADMIDNSVGNPHYFQQMTRMLMYRSPDGSRTWLIREFDNMNTQNDIQIKRYDKAGNMEMELYAKKGTWSKQNGWTFYDVSLVDYKSLSLVNDYSPNMSKNKTPSSQELLVPVVTKYPIVKQGDAIFEKLGNVVETPTDIVNTVKSPDQISTADILRRLQLTKNADPIAVATLETELYSRYALPWVCLFSVMLGIPLAGKNARRGIVVSIMSAVAVVVIYSIISQIFVLLGNSAIIPPFVAGVIPTLALGVYCVIYVNKYR